MVGMKMWMFSNEKSTWRQRDLLITDHRKEHNSSYRLKQHWEPGSLRKVYSSAQVFIWDEFLREYLCHRGRKWTIVAAAEITKKSEHGAKPWTIVETRMRYSMSPPLPFMIISENTKIPSCNRKGSVCTWFVCLVFNEQILPSTGFMCTLH